MNSFDQFVNDRVWAICDQLYFKEYDNFIAMLINDISDNRDCPEKRTLNYVKECYYKHNVVNFRMLMYISNPDKTVMTWEAWEDWNKDFYIEVAKDVNAQYKQIFELIDSDDE